MSVDREVADQQASEWLRANEGFLWDAARRRGQDEDAVQEARIAVLDAFRRGTWSATKGALDPYMRSVALIAIKGVAMGLSFTGEERSPGGDVLAPRRQGRAAAGPEKGQRPLSIDLPLNEEEATAIEGATLFEERGYAEVDGQSVVESVLEDVRRGLSPVEATKRHDLRPPRKPARGVYWRTGSGPGRGAPRWSVSVTHKGKRHFGGEFRSLRAAEARVTELRAKVKAA